MSKINIRGEDEPLTPQLLIEKHNLLQGRQSMGLVLGPSLSVPKQPDSARQSLQFEAFLSQPCKTPNRLVETPKQVEEKKDSHVPIPSRKDIEELFASIHELN